jgi:hypothetical protein
MNPIAVETNEDVDRILGPLTQKNQRPKRKRTFKKAFRKTVGDMYRDEPFPYKTFFFNPKLSRRAQRKPVPGVLDPHRHGKILRPSSPPTEYPKSSNSDDPLRKMPLRNRKYTHKAKKKRRSSSSSSSSSPYIPSRQKSPQRKKVMAAAAATTTLKRKRRTESTSPLSRSLKRTIEELNQP